MKVFIDYDDACIWLVSSCGGIECEVPADKVAEWERIEAEYNEMQDEMKKIRYAEKDRLRKLKSLLK